MSDPLSDDTPEPGEPQHVVPLPDEGHVLIDLACWCRPYAPPTGGLPMSDETMADFLRDRYGPDLPAPKHDVLWAALMTCYDCPHRMIDHDEVAMRCTRCRCNQSDRGLSSRSDERLMDLGRAMRDAWPAGVTLAPTPPDAPIDAPHNANGAITNANALRYTLVAAADGDLPAHMEEDPRGEWVRFVP